MVLTGEAFVKQKTSRLNVPLLKAATRQYANRISNRRLNGLCKRRNTRLIDGT
jgi:hypothetical protein